MPTTQACSSTASTTLDRCSNGPVPAKPPPASLRDDRPGIPQEALGVEVVSHVISIGASKPYDGPPPQASDLAAIDASPVRAFDEESEKVMIAEIEAAKKDGDTLGGIVEVVVHGLPVGLGSFTSGDNRLDSQLAGAVMGIQAIKGVEIGDGFETARRRGSVAHDEMYPGPDGVMRSTNRAGGLEGGMTNGQPLRVRAAMKPISTVPRALATVDMATGDEAVAIHQRSDVCAVPAAGVVVETMVALVLARAALEKFGGTRSPRRGPTSARTCARCAREEHESRKPSVSRLPSQRGRQADGAQGDIDRHAGSGKSTIGRRLARALQVPLLDTDAKIVETTGRSIADLFVEGEQEFRRIEEAVVRTALAEHDGIVSLGGGAITSQGVREALAGHTVIFLEISAAEGVRRTDRRNGASAARRRRSRPEVPRPDDRTNPAVPAGRDDARQYQPPQSRRGCAPHRRAPREPRGAATAAAAAPAVVAPRAVVVEPAAEQRSPTDTRGSGRPKCERAP